jgi:hypothetical protein
MLALNVTTGSAAMAAGILVLIRAVRMGRPTAAAMFAILTAASWLLHHLANGSPEAPWAPGARWAGAVVLVAASGALVTDSGTLAAHRRSVERRTILAAALAAAVAALLFLGRGPQDVGGFAEAARMAGRVSRDLAMGAFAFVLVGTARCQARPAISVALLVYPGIFLGIYLHPASGRNVLAFGAAMIIVAALWLRRTWTENGADAREAAAIVLLVFALPLIGMATVRLQGGFEAATDGPVRAIALAAGPLLYAALRTRWAGNASDLS